MIVNEYKEQLVTCFQAKKVTVSCFQFSFIYVNEKKRRDQI